MTFIAPRVFGAGLCYALFRYVRFSCFLSRLFGFEEFFDIIKLTNVWRRFVRGNVVGKYHSVHILVSVSNVASMDDSFECV